MKDRTEQNPDIFFISVDQIPFHKNSFCLIYKKANFEGENDRFLRHSVYWSRDLPVSKHKSVDRRPQSNPLISYFCYLGIL